MKIDFVIAWVDGSDPDWLDEKNQHFPESIDDGQRFRDWDILKYWFRGVEKHANWVNKIYFVTWGHVPEFLDVNHPKIEIIKHTDYLDSEYLPTYSANPIELNFHKIKGLSEHFVYFNDDMFIIKDVKETDFFEKGLPKDVAVINPIVPKYYNSVANIMTNDIGVINSHFSYHSSLKKDFSKWINYNYGPLLLMNLLFVPWSKPLGLYQQHLPSSLKVSTYEEVWEKEYEILHATSLRKKRNNFLDVNQWLFKEWQIMKGDFSPRDRHFGKYIMVSTTEDVKKLHSAISNKKVKVVCINDHIKNDFESIVDNVKIELESVLGTKSSFEL